MSRQWLHSDRFWPDCITIDCPATSGQITNVMGDKHSNQRQAWMPHDQAFQDWHVRFFCFCIFLLPGLTLWATTCVLTLINRTTQCSPVISRRGLLHRFLSHSFTYSVREGQAATYFPLHYTLGWVFPSRSLLPSHIMLRSLTRPSNDLWTWMLRRKHVVTDWNQTCCADSMSAMTGKDFDCIVICEKQNKTKKLL